MLKKVGISVEVIDPRTLSPIDYKTILKSVRKTKRLVVADPGWHSFGAASEIISTVLEKEYFKLKSKPLRLCLPDSHTPMSKDLEKKYYLDEYKIFKSIKKLFKKKWIYSSLEAVDIQGLY